MEHSDDVEGTDGEEEEDGWDSDVLEGIAQVRERAPSPENLLPKGVAVPWTTSEQWKHLREKIKKALKRRNLPLIQRNQLLILRNFATLLVKGYPQMKASVEVATQWHEGKGSHLARRVRALARHYQTFESLPAQNRGGKANAKSLLNDESVQIACRSWLGEQKPGTVTPKKFMAAVNDKILVSLDLVPKRPVVERTARRWLLRLGFRRTLIKKGVYMDGHERPDVVKYRQDVYLPRMAGYEARMAHHLGADVPLVEPELPPGVRKIIIYFHDEACFHALDYQRSAWLGAGQMVMQKKSRGRLIHVSDFITPETGRLVERNQEGQIIDDARKVIFPGSKGDAWWDCEQLMVQMKHALEIHKRIHPNATALFVFDNSSAHGSLPPNALKAFEMNKSNGGKQRVQRDTVIPMSNPSQAQRGQPQAMTLEDGTPKGLQAVLEERGFDTHKKKAKCSPICPFENTDCCLARMLSKQEDFMNQVSMLETEIRNAGQECIFLPKFHCELNPIEMVSIS